MKPRLRLMIVVCAMAALAAIFAAPVAAQDSLAAARDLYSSAAYDDALAALGRLRGSDYSVEDRRSIDLYRALCLLALNRSTDADRAIEAMVAQYPAYHPADADMPPRVLALRATHRLSTWR